MTMKKTLRILGIRGVPAAHGGFETFAEYLSVYLASKGWHVVVYCQHEGTGPVVEDLWQGVSRVNIPVKQIGPLGTILFDWHANLHAARRRDVCLTLGYNTAIFCLLLRLKGIPNLINMDGIEWSRSKWGTLAKAWFWINEWVGCWVGDHLIADHPRIQTHLETRVCADKITMIAYGAEALVNPSSAPVIALGLTLGNFLTVIARAEPENSLLEIVTGFSRKKRGMHLVVLGNYAADNTYQCAVKAAASAEVVFVGAIYNKEVVQALRFHSTAYIHGHQVGGTNPSLVEALGAGNAVIAHNNHFNRWVAADSAIYFTDASSFSECVDELIGNPNILEGLRQAAVVRFNEAFTWNKVLQKYEELLLKYLNDS